MLSVGEEDGLSIIFCNGPVDLSPMQGDEAHHHHGDIESDSPILFISPICSDWSTSSTLALYLPLETLNPHIERGQETNPYNAPKLTQIATPNQLIRAPPAPA